MHCTHKYLNACIVLQYINYKAELTDKINRKAMHRNWSNQKANPALKTKAGNK